MAPVTRTDLWIQSHTVCPHHKRWRSARRGEKAASQRRAGPRSASERYLIGFALLTICPSDWFTYQLTANQLIQSHTPLKNVASQYADKDVLVLGGRRDECRRVAQS